MKTNKKGVTMKNIKEKKLRPVLITTEFRGVFFGWTKKTDGDVIRLKDARNCIYWDASIGGFMGLASKGPGPKCRVGAKADIEVRKVTSVVEMSAEAVKKWEMVLCVS